MAKIYKIRDPFHPQRKEGDYTRSYRPGDQISLTDAELSLYGHMVEELTEPEADPTIVKSKKTEAA